MYYTRYFLDIVLMTIIFVLLIFLVGHFVNTDIILLFMSFLLAIFIIDIGMNSNGRLVINVSTGLFKLVDWLSLKIIGYSKTGTTNIKK